MQPAIAYGLYVGSVVGAIALYLMAPRAGYNPMRIGALLGAAGLGGLWLWLARYLPELNGNTAPLAYYYVFSALAIAGATRVITHTRPIYSALWFVVVVLATAGLLLVLVAPFIAFALVIIYAGAILVTYVFVIMLAAPAGAGTSGSFEGRGRAGEPSHGQEDLPMPHNAHPRHGQEDLPMAHSEVLPEHDREAREPLAAVAAGFLLLAVLLSVGFGDIARNTRAAGPSGAYLLHSQLTRRAPQRIAARAAQNVGDRGSASRLDHVEGVGWDMFRGHPLALELAGVILLVALIGAVVLVGQGEKKPDLSEGDARTAGPTSEAA